MPETKIEVPVIVNTKYRKNYYPPGSIISISLSEVESLLQSGVIRKEDVPEIEDSNDKPVDKMTVPELKEYAEKHNINLGDSTKKEDILTTIQEAIAGGGNASQ